MTKPDPWFDTAVTRLADPQAFKVWSVIVSLFGDLAQQKGDRVSGAALTTILQPMGLKPEAIRVALHRLRKDGWIDSDRIGRGSVHFLTDYGRAQSAAVTPRIYDEHPTPASDWHLLIAEDGRAADTLNTLLLTEDYIALGRHTALGPGPLPSECEDLIGFTATAHAIPQWLKTRLFPDDLAQASATLRDAASAVSANQPRAGTLSAVQIATLRTLVIHRWRRMALRHPVLPPVFHPGDWPEPECRRNVFRLLAALPRPSVVEINDSL
ncbi:PaaX family transcriptional regulator C-terminal domain-containing protein [Ruegeria sp. 2205SS24-7]|uniref:PaaX family transcriptional regulator C-terminal domain-containing protein n=1 Tax=Ruegeria discodermiae TaxID=3064389 RepID=UPI002741420F|nr:PaaX family transcriptional regulator C-terminal domain-containing protein [Ruegeria sp. 2205SS24-7]MDP5218567.1 PaaX family transcriptional regulator C-terminal domain-containing protein [Ruegeria sp. 2205SS24-7]